MVIEKENGPLNERLPTRPLAHILRPTEAKAWQDGFAFLEAAREEVRQMREQARRGYASEYAQGYGDGKSAGDSEAARLVNEAVVKVDRYLAGIENEVVTLALDIVQRVLGDVDVGERVANAARRAVADIRRAKYIRITVHPDIAAEVEEHLATLASEASLGCSLEVQGDSALALHACVVATDIAVFDASAETQLEALRTAIGKDPRVEQ